ncbi:hypothetical protein VP193E371_P0154 [Vibrio phage 193E37-1]|nr:hypothetical protein VP193E371_P0154 [Vibrio phage 193E37-1]
MLYNLYRKMCVKYLSGGNKYPSIPYISTIHSWSQYQNTINLNYF